MIDHYFQWELTPGAHHCQSCLELAGQVHPRLVWVQSWLYPGSPQLDCGVSCKCRLVDAGEVADEFGDLGSVYLNSAVGRALGEWVINETNGDLQFNGTKTEVEVPRKGKEMETINLTPNPFPGSEGEIERREKLAMGAYETTPAGVFEIMAITAGDGNGWVFSADVLKESLPLWDGVHCFVDHAGEDALTHSIRDLAGICTDPEFVTSPQPSPKGEGVKLKLLATGPSGALLTELGRAILAAKDGGMQSHPTPVPDVGFSADVIFTAKESVCEKILRVLSLDLVYNPARGGEFIRALNQHSHTPSGVQSSAECGNEDGAKERNSEMAESEKPTPSSGFGNLTAVTVETELASMKALLAEKARLDVLGQEEEKAKAIRAEMCGYLLDAGLASSKLPAPAAERIRKQFAGKIFTAQELNASIEDARDLVSALTGGNSVQGPRIGGMVVTEDKLQAAVDDLLGAPRDPASKDMKIERLSGIRELYMMLTGDYDLHGGYYPTRTRLATTSDFTGLVKNALNKMVINTWEELGRAGYAWWQSIATVEHFNSLNGITGTLVGTVGDLPTVAEGGEYTELAVGDSPETATFTKYGGYIPLTIELIDRDMTRKLAAYPRELASASIRKISKLVAALFSASSGAGPTMADTGALFNATAVTTLGGHANLLTTALTTAQWETVCSAVYKQPMLIKQGAGYYGTGPRMAINPRYLLVPRELFLTARQILYPDFAYVATYFSNNMQQQQQGDVVLVPDWTDSTDWAAVCDPKLAPAIFVGERFGLLPEIYISGDELSPAVFSNDEHRLKIRHFLAVWVNDFRPLANNHV